MDAIIFNSIYEIASVEVGQHFYWSFGDYQVHGQVLINSWIVIGIILAGSLLTTRELKTIPESGQNFAEILTEFVRDIAKIENVIFTDADRVSVLSVIKAK